MSSSASELHPTVGAEPGPILAGPLQQVLCRLVPDPELRASSLGHAFLACDQVAREHPAEFRRALAAGRLEAWLLPVVKQSLGEETGERTRGGWLGVFMNGDGRAIESVDADNTDLEALDISRTALQKALALAESEGNEVMQRNLGWYGQRLAHRTYEAIARDEGKPAATIRTGVSRAKKRVLQVVHELQNAQPAPLNGTAPEEIEPLRKLWARQEIAKLEIELERTRERHGDNPHWLNLAALLANEHRDRERARTLYGRALIFADDPDVRGRILNNRGNLAEEEGNLVEAQTYWNRAHHLVPFAPAPLLNLLSVASQERNYASAQHYISQLSDLLNSGRLRTEERRYLHRRLRENPNLAWLRETEAWRLGPARWLRTAQRRTARVGVVGAALAVFAAFAMSLWLGVGASFAASRERVKLEVQATPKIEFSAPRPDAELLLAGDSMGKAGRPPGRPRPPRRPA